MKVCKTCKGKGFVFEKSIIFTGKYDRFFGMEMPIRKEGYLKMPCTKCFGKGAK